MFVKKHYFKISLCLLSACFLIIIKDYGFISDDYQLIFASLKNHFPVLSDWRNSTDGMIRPIIIFSYFLDYFFFGYQAFYYYATNLLIHIVNSFLLFKISIELFNILNIQNKELSKITALVFFICPQNLMNIFWIAGRNDLICSMFVFLSFLFLIYSTKRKKFRNLLYSIIFGALAFLSKETALLINFYSILLIFLYLKTKAQFSIRTVLLPYILLTLAYVIFRHLIFQDSLLGRNEVISLNSFSIMKYFLYGSFAMFVPIDISEFYPLLITKNYFIFYVIIIISIFLISSCYKEKLYLKGKFRIIFSGVILISILSLAIYLGRYPQMRLMYIHIPLFLVCLTGFLYINKTFLFSKIAAVIFIMCLIYGAASTINKYDKVNKLNLELINSLPDKSNYEKENEYFVVPALGRIGQIWTKPDVNLMTSLKVYGNIDKPVSNIHNLYYFELLSPIFEHIITLKNYNGNGFYSTINSKTGEFILETSKTIDCSKERNDYFKIAPLTRYKFGNEYVYKLLIQPDQIKDFNKIFIVYLINGHYKMEPYSTFLSKLDND